MPGYLMLPVYRSVPLKSARNHYQIIPSWISTPSMQAKDERNILSPGLISLCLRLSFHYAFFNLWIAVVFDNFSVSKRKFSQKSGMDEPTTPTKANCFSNICSHWTYRLKSTFQNIYSRLFSNWRSGKYVV